jgi:conjugative element/phage-associated large polyvalent protein
LSPDFMVRNIVRDFMTAFVNSKSALFTPVDTAKGLISVIRKDADFQDWLKGGGANSTMVAMDRAYLQESLTKLAGETGLMDRSWNVVTSPFRGLRMISELAENATRLGEFKRLTGEGKADIQAAAFGSREVTLDFARIGASMRAYNMITAFGNAQIQGLDRIGRAFTDAPLNTTAKVAGGITLPSVLLWWANHDDPRYKELPHWQKDMFWIVMTKDHIYRIPKPFELGVVFGSGVERILDLTVGNNPDAFDKFSKSVFDIITPNVTPTAFQPLVEQYANRSTMNDRTLIPKDQEKNLPEYQYTPYTTELTKKLGQVISAFPGMREAANGPGAPFGPAARALTTPVLMENYVRAWTGGLGMYVLQGADAGLRKTGALPDPIKPASTLADIPVVKAFVVRYPSASAQSIQDFYDQHEVTKKFYDTWLSKAQEGDVDAMTRIQAAGGPMMFMRLDAIKETLTEHSKLVRDINKNQTIKPEEKRQLIDSLYYNMIEIGKAGKGMLKESEKALKAATESTP